MSGCCRPGATTLTYVAVWWWIGDGEWVGCWHARTPSDCIPNVNVVRRVLTFSSMFWGSCGRGSPRSNHKYKDISAYLLTVFNPGRKTNHHQCELGVHLLAVVRLWRIPQFRNTFEHVLDLKVGIHISIYMTWLSGVVFEFVDGRTETDSVLVYNTITLSSIEERGSEALC